MNCFETILAADIGGTNTRLLLFKVSLQSFGEKIVPGHVAPGIQVLSRKYENKDFKSCSEVIQVFLKEAAVEKPPITACLAVAGPVKNNVVVFTNRDSWSIDGYLLGKELGIKRVRLVNDFLAAGYGLLTLNETSDCVVLQSAKKNPLAPIACIGAGTGLGECFLTPDPDGSYRCFPSEGGHAEFAPRNELETRLLSHLKAKFQQKHRVSVERVVSGSGLANIYEYLAIEMPDKVNPAIHAQIEEAGDLKGAVIATNQQNELCKQTMEIFTTAYGAEAGVAALKWMPFGGLYLTGGLTPKNIDLIKDPSGPFLQAFLDKGRVSGMLVDVPVFAVMVENLGERGAHLVAFKDFQEVCIEEVPTKTQAQISPHESNAPLLISVVVITLIASLGIVLSKHK